MYASISPGSIDRDKQVALVAKRCQEKVDKSYFIYVKVSAMCYDQMKFFPEVFCSFSNVCLLVFYNVLLKMDLVKVLAESV